MRSILLASVAAMALGTTLTPVVAGPFWFLGKTIKECVEYGVVDKDAPQVQCASNSVDGGGGFGGMGFFNWFGSDSDGNKQIIKQRQKAVVFGQPEDTLQLQIARNDLDDGDDNTQIVKQSQSLFGSPENDEVQQLQVGVNDVEDGDDNFQLINQSQSLVIISYPQ